MAEQEQRYFAYLLRMWRANGGSQPIWRASLQCPGSTATHGFGSLDELFAFLRRQAGVDSTAADGAAPDDLGEAGSASSRTE